MLSIFYFHPDHLGSSSYITNSAGVVSQHMEYLPFGETLTDEHLNSTNSPFKFNGKERDEETGNYYYSARYYDPKLSIFISVDPLADKYPGVSAYAYCLNNPIIYIDPDGRDLVNGETARREKLEDINNGQKANIDAKYQGQLDKKKKDFATTKEFDDYKTSVKNYKTSTEVLANSREKEKQIFDAINDFAATDENNYNLVNNLEYKDGNGETKCVDVVINAGAASGSGGGGTGAVWTQNADGTYQGISSIITTLDFRIVDPISNVLAHEMGHAYGMTINPSDKFKFYTKGKVTPHDCHLPENRHHFRSESAMDFEKSYDLNKSRKSHN